MIALMIATYSHKLHGNVGNFHTFSQHFAAIDHLFCRNSESVAGVAGDSGAAGVAAATSGTTPMAGPSTANPVTVAATPVAVPAAAATPAPAAATAAPAAAGAGPGAGPGVPVVGA